MVEDARCPRLVRRPEMARGDLYFTAEWQGQEIRVVVTYEAMSTIGGAGFSTRQPDAAYLQVFDDKRPEILKVLAGALNAGRSEGSGTIMLVGADFPDHVPLISLSK